MRAAVKKRAEAAGQRLAFKITPFRSPRQISPAERFSAWATVEDDERDAPGHRAKAAEIVDTAACFRRPRGTLHSRRVCRGTPVYVLGVAEDDTSGASDPRSSAIPSLRPKRLRHRKGRRRS